MSILSFPTGYPIAEQNTENNQLELTQGWIQAFSLFNIHLEGNYSRSKISSIKSLINKNTFNPLVNMVYINYTDFVASDELTFPYKLWGFLDVRDSGGAVVQTIHCQGVKTVTVNNINEGDTITGTLSKGE